MKASIALALRMLVRDWRAGELRTLALALILAVASVTSVGFFADRVRQALTREAQQLLGADIVAVADHPWVEAVRAEAARRGLSVLDGLTFISMARTHQEAQLAGIKAVSTGHPLRGKLRIAPGLNQPDAATAAVPALGTVWIDERAANALAAEVGGSIELGDKTFTVSAILTLEPDRGASFFNFAPRVMMRIEDVPATGLVQPGSRISYQLLIAGDQGEVAVFENWLTPRLGRGESLQSLGNARPEIRNALERGQNFVGLAALLAVVLAAVAVLVATRRYMRRHLDGYAIMRCAGASQRQLATMLGGEFTALGAVAGALGCALGYVVQFGIAALIAKLIAVPLPQPTLVPALQGFITGFALLLGFALPALAALKSVPAIRVIRREIGTPRANTVAGYTLGLITIGALLVWQAGDTRLGFIVLAGLAGAGVLFAAIAYGVLCALAAVSRMRLPRLTSPPYRGGVSRSDGGGGQARRGREADGVVGVTWRYGIANLRRRAGASVLQILALAFGLTAILLLTFTRDDLIGTWREQIPPDAPNRFVINIQPDQVKPLAAFFEQHGLPVPVIYPMVRGRYVALDDAPVAVEKFHDRERRLVEREFNVSYMEQLPGHNRVVQGHWFTPDDYARGALSIEEGIARSLDWKIGDRLSWQVAGRTFTAPIVNIRSLDWDSMQVNFFVIATPGLLLNAPASYITSFHLPPAMAQLVTELSQRFPNFTVIDVSQILRQMQQLLDQATYAVQLVFLFALACGILVLYSALRATEDDRIREAAVMRALGAARKHVLAAQRAEFGTLAVIAGLLAAIAATALGFVIARQVFTFPYHVNPWIWLAGPLLGLACAAFNVFAAARAVLNRPPLEALRES